MKDLLKQIKPQLPSNDGVVIELELDDKSCETLVIHTLDDLTNTEDHLQYHIDKKSLVKVSIVE
jgi:hypothetical protein